MAVVVIWITIPIDEVAAVHIVNTAVAVVVQAIVRDLAWIDPQLTHQIRMGEVNAGVNDGDGHGGIAPRDLPGLRSLNLIQVPLSVVVLVVGWISHRPGSVIGPSVEHLGKSAPGFDHRPLAARRHSQTPHASLGNSLYRLGSVIGRQCRDGLWTQAGSEFDQHLTRHHMGRAWVSEARLQAHRQEETSQQQMGQQALHHSSKVPPSRTR